jgi:hypothetical protein
LETGCIDNAYTQKAQNKLNILANFVFLARKAMVKNAMMIMPGGKIANSKSFLNTKNKLNINQI